jgi:hypothetical protein
MSKSAATLLMGIKLAGIGVVRVEIQRILSPMTVEALMRTSPITSRGRPFLGNKNLYMISDLNLKVGIEKGKNEMEKGDIAYFAQQDALLIALESSKTPAAVNIVGRVTKDLELFAQAPKGTGVTIAVKKPPQ